MPSFTIPCTPGSDPDIPTSPDQLQMSVYTETVQANARTHVEHPVYLAAVVTTRAYFRSHIGPIPLSLVDSAFDPFLTDDTVIFTVPHANYAGVGSEALEWQLGQLQIPFDGSTPVAARVAKDEMTHTAFLQQTGDTIPDYMKMFGLRASAAGQDHV